MDVTKLTFRPPTLEDAELAADLMTAAYPPEPTDPVLTRYRWEHPSHSWPFARFIVELDARPVGVVRWSHAPWEEVSERVCELDVSLDRARLEADLLASLYEWVGRRAADDGARTLNAFCAEDELICMAVLERLGYERDRTDRAWELDLRKHRERLLADAAAALEKTRLDSVDLTTLAAWGDPDRVRKVHALSDLTRHDIPHTLPIPHQSFEDFVDRINAPDLSHDRFWIACHADRVVALSFMRFPPVRGNVWTGYTCSHPEYRSRGLARAVKLQSMAQAIGLGVPVVRTANDSENAPMLHINEQMGYEPLPGFVSLLKRVET
jgi:mycothiol synthase